MNYAVIDINGNVVNVIIWDGIAQYDPGDNMTLVMDPNAPPIVSIGWTYTDGTFSPPAQQ